MPNSESRNRYQIGLVWLGTFFEQDLSVFPRFLNIHDSPWPINQSLSTHKVKPCNVIILKFISRIFPIDFLPINNSDTSSVFSIFQHFIYTKYIKQYLTQEYKPFQAIRRKERGEGGIKESNFSFFFFLIFFLQSNHQTIWCSYERNAAEHHRPSTTEGILGRSLSY